MRAVLVISAAALAGAAAVYYRNRQDASASASDGSELVVTLDWLATAATQETAELIDGLTGGALKISAMANVSPAILQNGNVQAFLRVIRRGEGTADEAGYRRLFGGALFEGFADHPRKTVTKSGYTSTAAGAYQFLAGTWDETKRVMGLRDFSPASQDLGAVGRIAARGALDDVIAGRLDAAIRKCAREWASLPGSPYGQPVISMATAAATYGGAGGMVNA
jgi:muramidase (phage lysozyme)